MPKGEILPDKGRANDVTLNLILQLTLAMTRTESRILSKVIRNSTVLRKKIPAFEQGFL
jgi:hypothetical protein